MKFQNAQIEKKFRERGNIHIGYEQTIKPYHQKIAELVVKYTSESATVLDIGCGVGHILSEINRRNPNLKLFAADIDKTTLNITQNRTKIEKTIKIDSIENLFESDSTYDAIVLSHVLEHTHNPLDNVKSMMGMLKPGGILVLAVPNPVRLPVILGNLTQKHYVNRGHIYAWDRSHWINFLENIAQLDVIEYSQDFFPIPILTKLQFMKPVEIMLGQIFPWLTFSNIAAISNGDKRYQNN